MSLAPGGSSLVRRTSNPAALTADLAIRLTRYVRECEWLRESVIFQRYSDPGTNLRVRENLAQTLSRMETMVPISALERMPTLHSTTGKTPRSTAFSSRMMPNEGGFHH